MKPEAPEFNDLLCAISDESNIAKVLSIVKSGIDINRPTRAGCTPLMFAVMPNEYGDHNTARATYEMVKALLSSGAKAPPTDKFGMTALDYANQWIDPNWKDMHGDPAVVKFNDEEIMVFKKTIELIDTAIQN